MENSERPSKITSVAIAVGGSIDSGKCFGFGTKVLLYNGLIETVENITTNHVLMGDDSMPRHVIETHSGVKEMFEITTKENKKYIANEDHILCLKYSQREVPIQYNSKINMYILSWIEMVNKKYLFNYQKFNDRESALIFYNNLIKTRTIINFNEIVEISIKDYIDLPNIFKDCLKWYTTSVNFNNQPELLKINPYVFGLKFCSSILEENNSEEYLTIPNELLFATKENRKKFLFGVQQYLSFDDTKLNLNNYLLENFKLYPHVKFEKYIDKFIFLVESLGYIAEKTFLTHMNNKSRNFFCLSIKITSQILESSETRFTIKSIGIDNYWGFQITDNGRFLLSDFSVVHNSSIVGVLSSNIPILDDGNGSARKLVARHLHEIESGRTSDISTRAYDIPNSPEAITLIDLCGHETYFKTTTFGVSGYFPDYGFLIVSANRGILPMTKQHMRLFMSLSVPFLIIITHADLAEKDVYKQTIDGIAKTCVMLGNKVVSTLFVNNLEDQELCKGDLLNHEIVPVSKEEYEKKMTSVVNVVNALSNTIDGKQMIFPVITMSNKTGFYLDVIKIIMSKLKPRNFWHQIENTNILNDKVVKQFKFALEKQQTGLSNILPPPPELFRPSDYLFYIDSSYNVKGIGLVVTGINRGSAIIPGPNSYAYIGPFGKEFKKIRIKSNHNNMRQFVPVLENHHRGCVNFALVDKSEIKKEQIKKGMVLISSLDMSKNVCYRFRAVITMFTHGDKSITITQGYSPVIHLNTIRQTARMILDPRENNGNNVITFEGKNSTVIIATFKFKQHPEFIEPYNRFLLRSGSIQGIGLVIGITPVEDDLDGKPDYFKPAKIKRKRINQGQTNTKT